MSAATTASGAGEIPELEPHCSSWVITSPSGEVMERYERETVERAAKAGYRVETAAGYLGRINREIAERNQPLVVTAPFVNLSSSVSESKR